MHLQGSHSGHKHHCIGYKARVPALDVEELLHANVSTKACLSHWKENISENTARQTFPKKVSPTNPSFPTSFKAIISAKMEELP